MSGCPSKSPDALFQEAVNGRIQSSEPGLQNIFFKIEYLPVGDGKTARITDTGFWVAIDLQKNPTKNCIYL